MSAPSLSKASLSAGESLYSWAAGNARSVRLRHKYGFAVHACNPNTRRLRQEDRCELKTSLDYKVSHLELEANLKIKQ